MKMMRLHGYRATLLLALGLFVAVTQPCWAATEKAETFNVLQVGAQTYRNVTVTDKSKTSIFITHAEGMANIKVADLDPEVRTKLGYVVEKPKPTKSEAAAAWTRQTLNKLDLSQVRNAKQRFQDFSNSDRAVQAQEWVRSLPQSTIYCTWALMVLLYLSFCHCCRLICKRAGKPAGPLVWLPVLKIFPLLRAAGMSAWWFLSFFALVGFVIVPVIWPFKIAKACGKGPAVGLFMLLPVLNILAFLYLAFSGGGARKEVRPIQGMSLKTA